MTDDLTAEIAAHRPHDLERWVGDGPPLVCCASCHKSWPCLVRRLCERMTALSEELDIHADRAEAAERRAERAERENQNFRSLLDCTEFALKWLADHVSEPEGKDWKARFDGRAFFECDCSEDGGYMEWDTNAYIHTEKCSSIFEDSLGALQDQIKAALADPAPPSTDAPAGGEGGGRDA